MTNPVHLSSLAQAVGLATALQETLASLPAEATANAPELSDAVQRIQGDLSTLVGAANAAGVSHPLFPPSPAAQTPLAWVLGDLIRATHHHTGHFHQSAVLSLQMIERYLTDLTTALQEVRRGPDRAASGVLVIVTSLKNRLSQARQAIQGASIFLHQGLATLFVPPKGSPLTDNLVAGRVEALMHWEVSEPAPAPPVAPVVDRMITQPILVVDDDQDIIELLEMSLGMNGFSNIFTANDGVSALAILSANPAIAAIITDLMMPGMDGLELAREIWKRRPSLPVVFLSGNVRDIGPKLSADELGLSRLIAKPFPSMEELAEMISKLVLPHE